MDHPLFSVIVPVFNMEKLLPRCLDSLLMQPEADLEFILVDDGSADSSPRICDLYATKDTRFKVIHKKNAGVSEARNSGLREASGKYISFVDPDDWIEPDMYRILSDFVHQYSPDIIRFNACRSDSGLVLNATSLNGMYSDREMVDKVTLPMIGSEKYGGPFYMGVPWIYVFRRDVIERHQIRFDKQLHRCEDRLFCITAMLHARDVLFIDDALYHYSVSDNSLSNRYDSARWGQELLYLDKLRNEYNKVLSPDQIRDADSRIKSDYVLRAITSIDNMFFSVNNESFSLRFNIVKSIINNHHVRESVQGLQREKMGLKSYILYFCVKNRLPFLLTVFQTLLLWKNR